ncbi:MAG: HINT domain-containing protein [Clostridium sp.]|nr:HINT domain-containing protein [Clostridium sp.]
MKDEGFLPAGKLYIGDKLLDPKGNVLIVEDFKFENTDKPVMVYNFQVEDFHTYYVENSGILVHNAHYAGEKGTQTNSTTTWKNGKTERIDVENGAPGNRDGNIHYHDSNNKKYWLM